MTDYKLPDPYAYIYEFDSVFGLHQSFSSREYNGSKPSCTVLVYTADQLREEVAKAEQRGMESSPDLTIAYMSGFADGKRAMREECVKVCEKYNYGQAPWMIIKALKEIK